MNCYRPFLVKPTPFSKPVLVPCGHCINCKKERSKAWAMRLILESFSWQDASFVTLTYSDKFILSSQSGRLTLVKEHLQKFIKRLRFKLSEEGRKIMYYAVGEYGSHTFRPHYHAIIFGLSLSDLELVQKEWPFGFVRVDEMNLATCNYVAGYVQKKLYGSDKKVYDGIVEPFSLMSKGISKRYFLENKDKLLSAGFILYKGKKLTIPRYYFKLMQPKDFFSASEEDMAFFGDVQAFKRRRRKYVEDVVLPRQPFIPNDVKEQRAKAAEILFDTRSVL